MEDDHRDPEPARAVKVSRATTRLTAYPWQAEDGEGGGSERDPLEKCAAPEDPWR